MKALLLCLLTCGIVLAAPSAKNTELAARQLVQLQQEYTTLTNRLESVTQLRWEAREQQAAVKERNKEALDRLRAEQERLYAEVARAREERLARDQAAQRESDAAALRRDEWHYLADAITARVATQTQAVLEGTPLGQAELHRKIVALEQRFPARSNPLRKLEGSFDIALEQSRMFFDIALERATIIDESNEPQTVRVLRIGQALAYALGENNSSWVLGPSAVPGRFEWIQVSNPQLSALLPPLFADALTTGRLNSALPVDILMNEHSRNLIAGKQQGRAAAFLSFVKSGGIVMIPLGLIVVWALLLIVGRMIVYARKDRSSRRFLKQSLPLLDQNKLEEAGAVAASVRGVLGSILSTCLHHAQWNRPAAEKAIKELLLKEVPQLDKNLDTLAVLAAAAPLLGLLGTVSGMIQMFEAITRFGSADPKLLAGGISQALVTTQVGLSVAIPLLLVHNHLRNRRNRIQADMELAAMSILNRLWPRE